MWYNKIISKGVFSNIESSVVVFLEILSLLLYFQCIYFDCLWKPPKNVEGKKLSSEWDSVIDAEMGRVEEYSIRNNQSCTQKAYHKPSETSKSETSS